MAPAAASSRRASAYYPRGTRGGGTTRLHGLSARHPRRRRDPSDVSARRADVLAVGGADVGDAAADAGGAVAGASLDSSKASRPAALNASRIAAKSPEVEAVPAAKPNSERRRFLSRWTAGVVLLKDQDQ